MGQRRIPGTVKRLVTQLRALKDLTETNGESNPPRGTANHEWTRMDTNNLIGELSFLQNSLRDRLSCRQT